MTESPPIEIEALIDRAHVPTRYGATQYGPPRYGRRCYGTGRPGSKRR